MHMPLEIFAGGRKHTAELEDLSRTGMFLRTAMPLARGTLVHVAFSDGVQRYVSAASVMHALDETDARALGRRAGVGIELVLPTKPNERLFSIAVDRLLAQQQKPSRAADRRIVIATSHVRLIERLAAVFGEAGFAVVAAANGIEAIAACLRAQPDVLLVERVLPIVDGIDVVERISQTERLAGLPIVVMSDDVDHSVEALERGAMDFVAKPFSTDELVLRVRRLVRPRPVVFRGDLRELRLTTLLTLFEHERKSGQLVVHRGGESAWIDLSKGRVIDARSTELEGDTRTVLHAVLDWQTGWFELSPAPPALPAPDALPITHLLLEHACRRDEAHRPIAM